MVPNHARYQLRYAPLGKTIVADRQKKCNKIYFILFAGWNFKGCNCGEGVVSWSVMNQLTSNPTSFDKLKTVFFLGLTCNFTTFFGCAAVWIALARNEWVSGLIETALIVFSFAPVFMGDAVSSYTLGRIKLEAEKGWDDVQISVRGREKVAKFYRFYRALSILPAYLLAASIVATWGGDALLVQRLKIAFLVACALNFARSAHLLQRFIAPRLPGYGGRRLVWRMLIISGIFTAWYLWFYNLPHQAMSKLAIIASGVLYFIISGVLHPLPTRFSLLRPGRPASRVAFFSVELLSDEQLQAIPGSGIFTEALRQPLCEAGFRFLANIRMPLIELPLFQSWGVAMISADGRTLGLLLDTEVKKGPYRCLISVGGGRFVITTDFGSGQAKFPAAVCYKLVERSLNKAEMLKLHHARTGGDFEQLNSVAWQRLEELVKTILRYLESETAERRRNAAPAAQAGTATGSPATHNNDGAQS